ncbi:MAG: glutathione S-transferase family protein [Moorea sp. SIO2I5]|nr:glutathione S-transferase family protein [Moorena sp. SIO2I5]
MLRLYNFQRSGNCYKIRLLLNQLELPYDKIDVDIVKGESRTSEFIQKNINGKVPLLEIEPNKLLAESNAILFYLSENTQFLPNDPWERINVLRWMFFEQNSLEPSIGTVRYWITELDNPDKYQEVIQQKREQGYASLEVIENHLTEHQFFVGERYTIADICLFGYTHVAEEGGFDLSKFTAVNAWMERFKAQPKYISMEES